MICTTSSWAHCKKKCLFAKYESLFLNNFNCRLNCILCFCIILPYPLWWSCFQRYMYLFFLYSTFSLYCYTNKSWEKNQKLISSQNTRGNKKTLKMYRLQDEDPISSNFRFRDKKFQWISQRYKNKNVTKSENCFPILFEIPIKPTMTWHLLLWFTTSVTAFIHSN